MKLKFILSISFICFAQPSFAANYCANPNELIARAVDCTENEYISEAAVLCLDKIEREIATAQSLVKTSAEITRAQAKTAQTSLQNNAQRDYRFSKETLNALISRAQKAQEEVIAYESILAMPEDFDEPDITGLSTEAYLRSTPCHAENKQVIRDVAEDFDYILSDLEFARDTGEELETSTKGNQTGLNSLNTGPILDGTSSKTPPKAQKPLKTNSSGISESSLPKK